MTNNYVRFEKDFDDVRARCQGNIIEQVNPLDYLLNLFVHDRGAIVSGIWNA